MARVIFHEAALKPYAEKTSAGDLSVIDGPCIGTSAFSSSFRCPEVVHVHSGKLR